MKPSHRLCIITIAICAGASALLVSDRAAETAKEPARLLPSATAKPPILKKKIAPKKKPAPKKIPVKSKKTLFKPIAPKPVSPPRNGGASPPRARPSETMAPQRQAFRQDPEFPSELERQTLPACDQPVFSVAPVDIAKLYSISPLGNLAPPGHTFPTEHMFFHITSGGSTVNTIPLSAPANITLSLISFGHNMTRDPVDYTLWFALCRDVFGYYNHVKTISPELQTIVDKGSCMFPGEQKNTRCNIETLTPIPAGTIMGQVGRLQGNFDMGLIDFRAAHTFANPKRYGTRSLFIQCALDYYSEPVKSQLFSLLSRKDGACGTTAQDVPGTLAGNWFYGAARADLGGDWDKYISFAVDSQDPRIAAISIGGVFTEAGIWKFSPQSSGLVNRAFRDVTADGNIYCYEDTKMSGRILVGLTSATRLQIERQSSSCADPLAFVSPTTYER